MIFFVGFYIYTGYIEKVTLAGFWLSNCYVGIVVETRCIASLRFGQLASSDIGQISEVFKVL